MSPELRKFYRLQAEILRKERELAELQTNKPLIDHQRLDWQIAAILLLLLVAAVLLAFS